MAVLNHLHITTFIVQFGNSLADFCYSSLYGYRSYYCSGYCSGYFYNQYCVDDNSLSIGVVAGIVIGCLIFLAIFISVIVIVCSACTKKSGQTGRIVHPTQGVAMVSYSNAQHNYNSYSTPTGYVMSANMGYPPSGAVPPQPPSYSDPSYPPPNYSTQKQPQVANPQHTNQNNIVPSPAPIDHQSHEYR